MRPVSGIITFLTDFGLSDPYVGVMKGVVKSINPSAEIIDISHYAPSFDPRAAAIMLMVSYRYFPPGTIHVVVVDPGVGSSRRALLVVTRNYYFIGPDNGCLVPAARRDGVEGVWDISGSRFRLPRVSGTFHGRDVFSPVAAYLSLGYAPDELGVRVDGFGVELNIPKPVVSGGCVRGEVIYIDRFGNAMTNIEEDLVPGNPVIRVSGRDIGCRFVPSFSHVSPGSPACYINSWGFLEIAVYKGSAAERLGIEIGDSVEVCGGSG